MNYRIGEIRFPAVLQTREEFTIQLVKITFNFLAAGSEIPRHKTECGDAQRSGEGLEFRKLRDALKEVACQADIIGDHPHIALAPGLLNCKPDLESAKA